MTYEQRQNHNRKIILEKAFCEAKAYLLNLAADHREGDNIDIFKDQLLLAASNYRMAKNKLQEG